MVELDPYDVEGRRARPFVDGNIDIPRTIDDVQPYYIFDATELENSGAMDVEDFLKQRLTMNMVAETNAQSLGLVNEHSGTASRVDLRGVGATLVLVNGRRVAGHSIPAQGNSEIQIDGQPDLNGIPFNAIERIEVLPTSASGIYGGQAIGGVVNVVLKKSFQGGQVSMRYEDLWGGNAPRRSVNFNYGQSLEGGRTRFSLSASWSDAKPMRFRSVADWHLDYFARAEANQPNHISDGAANPWPGALANILPASTAVTALTFKDGTPLGSRITHVPIGIGPNATFEELKAGLLANAGTFNTDLPMTRTPNGLLRVREKIPERRSVNVNVTRQMWANLEANLSFSHNTNDSYEEIPPRNVFLSVPATSPHNPFQQAVRVNLPHNQFQINSYGSTSKVLAAGVIARLPWDWSGTLDYSWSENHNSANFTNPGALTFASSLASGALNVFVDPALFDFDLAGGGPFLTHEGKTRTHLWMVRGHGPLFSLPWGQPSLVLGGDYRRNENRGHYLTDLYPASVSTGQHVGVRYFPRDSDTTSGYAELTVPLVKQGVLPLLHSLELQVAGRTDRYTVSTGTQSSTYDLLTDPPTFLRHNGQTSGGEPVLRNVSYGAHNATFGLKYEPIPAVAFRASIATAFRPPTPSQLLTNVEPFSNLTTIHDPVTGLSYPVQTLGGGNPDLEPQNSESHNIGVIWSPRSGWAKDFRLNVEYYRIQQFDAIGQRTAQQLIDEEAYFPDRVIRDASGQITLVDRSMQNLFLRDTDGWDFSLNYHRTTTWGTFRGRLAHSYVTSLKTQSTLNAPLVDAIGLHPNNGGSPKHKGNMGIDWERKAWSAGWSMRYFGSYKTRNTAADLTRQGSDTVSSQASHDVVAGYRFDTRRGYDSADGSWQGKLLSGVSLQVGVRNVLNTPPSFDAVYRYFSPYGESRPRSFWVNVRKSF